MVVVRRTSRHAPSAAARAPHAGRRERRGGRGECRAHAPPRPPRAATAARAAARAPRHSALAATRVGARAAFAHVRPLPAHHPHTYVNISIELLNGKYQILKEKLICYYRTIKKRVNST